MSVDAFLITTGSYSCAGVKRANKRLHRASTNLPQACPIQWPHWDSWLAGAAGPPLKDASKAPTLVCCCISMLLLPPVCPCRPCHCQSLSRPCGPGPAWNTELVPWLAPPCVLLVHPRPHQTAQYAHTCCGCSVNSQLHDQEEPHRAGVGRSAKVVGIHFRLLKVFCCCRRVTPEVPACHKTARDHAAESIGTRKVARSVVFLTH